jgi:hypothetical protein
MTATPHVNKSTDCGRCGHSYGTHCESGMPHFDSEDHRYSCITQHCACGPCQCWAFVNPYTGAVTAWKRPVEPETLCATCGHPRAHHCRKGATGIEVNGEPRGCSHYMKAVHENFRSPPCCDSTACAEVLDVEQENFCPCARFVSPYARRKKRVKTMLIPDEELQRSQDRYFASQRPKAKTKAEILAEVCAEFPDVTLAELVAGSGLSRSYVLRVLRTHGITLKGAAKP